MKKTIIIIGGLFVVLSASAQYNRDDRHYDRERQYNNSRQYNYNPVVTLILNGDARAIIDGQTYSSGNYRSDEINSLQITTLQPGQHSLQIMNGNGGRGFLSGLFGGRNNTNTSSTFNLRRGYDMNIIVNANGRARIRETRNNNYQNNTYNGNDRDPRDYNYNR